MEDIQAKALQTFSKNLSFLSKVDEKLSQKIAYLQLAIKNGEYKENYSLEYKDEGYFDVQNLHDGSFLYGSNSIEISQKKADEVKYDKVSSVISLAYRNSFTKQTAEDLEKLTAVNFTMTPPVEYILSQAKGRGAYINKIYKFAFFGLGLGLHVNMIDEKIQAASYFFVEDNLELFYLSLFVCKYYEINSKAKLFFCILEDNDSFSDIFDAFFVDLWIRNDFLKFSLFSDAYASKISAVQNQVLVRPHFAYPANYLFRKNIQISKVLNEGYNFLNISKIYDNSPLKNKKVLFLAGGPSLGKQIKWVKKNRDKFFIISVFMISARLKNEGIKPDIFIHIDENEGPIVATLNKFSDYAYFENIQFIFAGSVPLEFFTPFVKKENIYLVEDRTRYKIAHGNLEFYSVGEAGYALSLIFGANELYLLGLDLALDSKTGLSHTEGHSSSHVTNLDDKDKVHEVGSLNKNIFTVAGNRGERVPTTPLFAASINAFNNYSEACLINNQKVYNLGDGAYLNKAIPFHVEDIKFNDEKNVDFNEMKKFLNSISTNSFSKAEEENIFMRKQDLRKKIKMIKKFASAKIKNKKDFYDNLVFILNGLTNSTNKNLSENTTIFTCYLEDISSFIGEYLNTKGADFSPEMLNKIRNKLSSELKRFVASFGYMDFDYIDANSYFKPSFCKGLETRIFKLDNFYAFEYSQIKEICFNERLKADIYDKLLDDVDLLALKDKKGVGFLASNLNLQDFEYLDFLKEILNKTQATLVAFYFEEYQQKIVKEVFKENLQKIQFNKINDINDLVNGCKMICLNTKDVLYKKGLMLLKSSLNVILANQISLNKTFEEVHNENLNSYKKLYARIKEFGYEEDFEQKLQKEKDIFPWECSVGEYLLLKANIKDVKIDKNMRLKDYFIDIVIRYGMQSDEYLKLLSSYRFKSANMRLSN